MRQKELEAEIAALRQSPATAETLRTGLKACPTGSYRELGLWASYQAFIEVPSPIPISDKEQTEHLDAKTSRLTLRSLLPPNSSPTAASILPGTESSLNPLLSFLVSEHEDSPFQISFDCLPTCLELLRRFIPLGPNARIAIEPLYRLPSVPRQGGGRPQRAEYEQAREIVRKYAGDFDGRSVQVLTGHLAIGKMILPFSLHAAGRAVLYVPTCEQELVITDETVRRVSSYDERSDYSSSGK